MRHHPARSWRSYFLRRCTCGNKVPCSFDVFAYRIPNGPIPDGDTVLFPGYRRTAELLPRPAWFGDPLGDQ